MLSAFREWRDSIQPANTNRDGFLIVGMSANSALAIQDEAFKYGMHIFATKPVESIYLKIFVDAVHNMIAADKRVSMLRSFSSSSTIKTQRSNPLAKCISDVKEMLKSEGLDALSINGTQRVRITSYPLRC